MLYQTISCSCHSLGASDAYIKLNQAWSIPISSRTSSTLVWRTRYELFTRQSLVLHLLIVGYPGNLFLRTILMDPRPFRETSLNPNHFNNYHSFSRFDWIKFLDKNKNSQVQEVSPSFNKARSFWFQIPLPLYELHSTLLVSTNLYLGISSIRLPP